MVNVDKLSSAMREKQITIGSLAEAIGKDRSTLYRKLKNNGRGITIGEAEAIAKHLSLTAKEVGEIFFSSNVAETRQKR